MTNYYGCTMKDPIAHNESDGTLIYGTYLHKLAPSGGANSIIHLTSGEAVIIDKRAVCYDLTLNHPSYSHNVTCTPLFLSN